MFFNLSAVASPLSPLGTYMNMCLPKLVKSSTLFSRHIFLYKTLSPKMLIYVLQIYQATNSSPTFSPCKGTRENNFTGGCKQSCVPLLKSYLEMYISAYQLKKIPEEYLPLEPPLKVKELKNWSVISQLPEKRSWLLPVPLDPCHLPHGGQRVQDSSIQQRRSSLWPSVQGATGAFLSQTSLTQPKSQNICYMKYR